MAEVTKLTTFKNVVSIPNFITYLKTATSDIVVPEAGLISANLTTNGSKETWFYKSSVLQAAPDAQGTCIIELDETDDSAILAIINANPGYIWNVTQNEVVYCRSAKKYRQPAKSAVFVDSSEQPLEHGPSPTLSNT